ncbi:Nn.00g092220.m01.CDS01 [Neocucurbitaria sp. VM-36]
MAYHQQYHGHPQQRQQQYYEQAPPQQRQQHADYDSQYGQQYYDYGYDQGGNEHWDDGYYQQQGGWENAQQQGGYQQGNGYMRQPPQSQGRRRPSQDHYVQEQAYDEHYQQQPPQQQRPDPRRRPAARGDEPPPNPQQGRGVQRPPGLDRSLFNSAPHKNLPLDNPFPTFPTHKAKQMAPKDPMNQAMSHLTINDTEGQGASQAPIGRGQPMPPQNRGPEQPRPEPNTRQDSGNFEGKGPSQRGPPNRIPAGQRPPPMNINPAQGVPPQRAPNPKSPSQRAFGANTQRSMTMPQSLPGGGHGAKQDTQQWDEPGAAAGYHGPAAAPYAQPRPSTAGGVRQNGLQGQQGRGPAMPQMPPQQLQQQHYQFQSQPYEAQGDEHGGLDTFYDDYYDESNDRKSMTSTIDMPNFDAIPEASNRHRRGDSIDNHLSPSTGPSRNIASSAGSGRVQDNSFQQQAFRSRSQPDLHEQYSNNAYEMAGDAPPVPTLPRANTGFSGPNGLPNGPRGRGPPSRGMTIDGTQRGLPSQGFAQGLPPNSDARYARQPPPVQRVYSDESAYSEPPLNTMRNFSSPVGSGVPVPRPGTAGPVPGRAPSDTFGRRPDIAHSQSNPDSLPAHPTPVRAGLMQQTQQQQQPAQSPPSQSARPPPVRQYNSDASRASYESQPSVAQRRSSVPHPVTFDELNRLRNTWKANPSDIATGLKLAKKLVEAASVLADEGGTADTRTKNKNREKFILEAHKIVKKLVHGGSPDAMFYLADCYGQGLLGLQVDTKEAFALYQSAAKGGHAASAYRTAVCCEMGHEEGGGTKRDPLKAVQWYRRAASLGDTPAMYKMGMVLLKGLLGQQKNLGEAINMLKRAADRADRDNPHALHELALIYEAQTGNERIIRDEAYALQLFQQAADLGYKFSQFRLGQAYEYGLLGCQIDARTSIAWYTKSAAQEEHQSELALSGWYLTGIAGVLEQSDTEAYLWARKAACAEPPLPKALFAMGYFTEVGIGCPRSLDEAKRWYGRAAAYKFPKAQERLEELKRGGSKVQMKRERLSRTNQKQQEENCTVM